VYILDTNIVSNALSRHRNQTNLQKRILQESPENIFISIITIEEILRGALAAIQKQRKTLAVINVYQQFEELSKALQSFQVLPYTIESEHIYQSLPTKVKRIGTQDCRIAATACSKGYTLVTVNVFDFKRIGIAPVEDWTR
jgi:tRNA(fMet)-specific endonuclease VapC